MPNRVLTTAFCFVTLYITILLNSSIIIRRLGLYSSKFIFVFLVVSAIQFVLASRFSKISSYCFFVFIPYISSFASNLIVAFLWFVDDKNKPVSLDDAIIVSAWSPFLQQIFG
jgi:hypothetical protein